jgi:hypothetical protein
LSEGRLPPDIKLTVYVAGSAQTAVDALVSAVAVQLKETEEFVLVLFVARLRYLSHDSGMMEFVVSACWRRLLGSRPRHFWEDPL